MQDNKSVHAVLNYTLDDGTIPEAYFYEPPPGKVSRMPGNDPHQMELVDGWSRATTFSLDREGFAIQDFHTSFDRFDDAAAVRDQFWPTIADYVRTSVGARQVMVFDHTVRSKVNVQQQTAEH